MPCLGDADRAEINRNHVERGLGATVNRRRDIAENIIGAELFHQIRQDRG